MTETDPVSKILYFKQFKTMDNVQNHVKWVPCHHGMPRTQVADGRKASRYGG